MQAMIHYASRLPARHRHIACALLVATAIVLGCLLIKASWQALQLAKAERLQYEQTVLLADVLRETEAQLTAELAKHESARKTLPRKGNPDQRIVEALGVFNALASKHNVVLYRVTPGNQRSVPMYEEMPLNVEVSGRYADMAAWLLAVEQEIPALAVTQFDMARITHPETGTSLVTKVNIALYAEREGQGQK